ncbi:hypothetical protein A3715_08790 [Oleiphilus sp. HI0009]|uniref:outer membrane protein transport protein n=1 Tax=unclassified Oleiphilus TaxID=2631174 RepID=UPI0007C341EA|nr:MULTISPECIES: outer membrane protein transport protein [unclassified Oleiphilus]KZX79105.1 hypothetical protein A3715_19725 [Oleiphilus sp. HI0009]MCH2157503.1 outer membrane protein transport protein [Oleiphilaceae bacterium]KZX79457.1 hypothetical protein A3715_08790 [Oleiphilus sp. HI0009]KZY61278.1 hypothetical protein A3738_22810 [Oleiphilus sp. HI0066]KZY64427.1 hypothetical protein A3738_10235 [Oleiphilus sp. HI0066]
MTAMPGEFALTPQDTRSESDWFYIPSFGYKTDLSNDLALNVNLYANSGMNTDYDESVFYAGETGVDLSQVFLNTSIAYKVSENTNIGDQRFKAKGLGSFAGFSQDPIADSDNWAKGRNPSLQSQNQQIELEMSQLELIFGANF